LAGLRLITCRRLMLVSAGGQSASVSYLTAITNEKCYDAND
jgi:hypothetical protein